MPTPLLMPALSPDMTEGTLARWIKKEGDAFKAGDVIAEIETDKATLEFEAVDNGILGKILVHGGTSGVAINTPIAFLLAEDESASSVALEAAPASTPPPAPPVTLALPHDSGRIVASPLARRMAEQAGLDLRRIAGSGPNGRIVRTDVEAAMRASSVASQAPVVEALPPITTIPVDLPPAGNFELVPHTTMRRVIARRLTEAKQTIPHFYLTVDIAIDALLKIRAELNAGNSLKLSVNDWVIRASALALRKSPAVNAQWSDEGVRLFRNVDVSVAVATPGGLFTPIIRNADQKGLAVISKEMKELASRARENQLKPEEYQGGTFSISNLGMFGIREFAAVINPPQGAILAVGAGDKRPIVKDDALAIATMMTATLSVDHRVIDGSVSAEFLGNLKGLLESPLTMLL